MLVVVVVVTVTAVAERVEVTVIEEMTVGVTVLFNLSVCCETSIQTWTCVVSVSTTLAVEVAVMPVDVEGVMVVVTVDRVSRHVQTVPTKALA